MQLQQIHIDRWRKVSEALRSGKYTQGGGRLRKNGERYCCLGVACEISGLGHWVDEGGLDAYHDGISTSVAQLSTPVAQYYGFPEYNYVGIGTKADGSKEFHSRPINRDVTLATLNDTGNTFSDIADVIDECLKTAELNLAAQ